MSRFVDAVRRLVAERKPLAEKQKGEPHQTVQFGATDPMKTPVPEVGKGQCQTKPHIGDTIQYGERQHHDPTMRAWLAHIKRKNSEHTDRVNAQLYGEDIENVRRLSGIVESDNSALLESRLSPASAEAKIFKNRKG